MDDFFSDFFGTGSWPPRWYCGKWSEFHGWLYIISDLAIWGAYFTIPFLLIHFIRRKKDIPFPKIFWLFGCFIFACGTTHLIDAVIFWFPIYKISAVVRFFTAVVSWATIYAIYKILPDAFSLKTPAELERVVSERTNELHISIAKMKFLADAMPQIVWTATPNGEIEYFNERAINYIGHGLGELTGNRWTRVIHPDDKKLSYSRWRNALRNGRKMEFECRLLSQDGSYCWHLIRAIPHTDENADIILWVGTATEIETQKKAEAHLEKMVAERTMQLEIANSELVQSNSDLEQFAAIASHDLQAPLRTIATYLDLLSEKNDFDEKSRQYVLKSINASIRMQELIKSLLALSQINLGDRVFNKVNLNDVIEKVTEDIRNLSKKQIRIEVSELPSIYGDEIQMQQLFQNLIGNGVKYNDNAVPTITITYQDSKDAYVFQVADDGIGVAGEYLSKIFEIFTRLSSDNKGSGLGLSISKRIVEKAGGTIWVDSEVGKGTTFYFSIPKRALGG